VAENNWPIGLRIERLFPSRDIVTRSEYPLLHLMIAIPLLQVQALVRPLAGFCPVPPGLNTVSLVPKALIHAHFPTIFWHKLPAVFSLATGPREGRSPCGRC